MDGDLSDLPYVERKIREAMARGEFDGLPGAGKPILDLDDDPLWWIKRWVNREGLGDAIRDGRSRSGSDGPA